MRRWLLLILSVFLPIGLMAQDIDLPDDGGGRSLSLCDEGSAVATKPSLVPTTAAGITFVTVGASPFFNSYSWQTNRLIREEVQLWRRNSLDNIYIPFENVTQYLPVATFVALGIAGVESRHDRMYMLRSTAMTYAIIAATVVPMKYGIGLRRPDHSGYTSFPSGHTAIAFAGAEMLRLEYSATSAWIPVAGYGVALITGMMRVFNDRHWPADVLAGVGIGIFSADISFWLNDVISRKCCKDDRYSENINHPVLWNLY